jgi:uncharacterized protein (TIRG00374 family)
MKARVQFFLKIAFAAVLIYFLLHNGFLKVDSLKALLTVQSITIGFLFLGANLWLLNWRWWWLLRSRGFDISLSQTYVLYLIGVFFNHALPSSVGGDVVKAYYIANQQKHRRVEAVLSVLIDRVLGLYSLLLLSMISVFFDFSFVRSNPEIRWMAMLCGILTLGMTVCLIIGFSSRLDRVFRITHTLKRLPLLHKVAHVFEAMQLFGKNKFAIVVSLFVSFVGQSLSVLFAMYIGSVLGFSLPLPVYLFCVPLGFVATALPVAPAGVGVGQVAFLFLFKAYSPESGDLGAAAITAFQLAMLSWGLIGSIFYIRYRSPALEEASNA